jgi:MFS family permease
MVQRLPIARYLGANICIWGVILACIGASQNFTQMAGLRFALGFFEGVVYPGFQLLTNTFYRKQEIQARNGAWEGMNGIAQALGGLIGFGIGHMEGVLNHYAWSWIQFIFGGATCLFGVIVFFFLIDDPRSPRWNWTEEEKAIVEQRLKDNGVKRHPEWKVDQAWETLRDPKTYAFFLASFLNSVGSGALNPFGTLIVQGLGFSVSSLR